MYYSSAKTLFNISSSLATDQFNSKMADSSSTDSTLPIDLVKKMNGDDMLYMLEEFWDYNLYHGMMCLYYNLYHGMICLYYNIYYGMIRLYYNI